AVPTRPGQAPRIRTKPGTQHRICEVLPAEREHLLSRAPVPDLDRAIVTSRHHGPAIGSEGHPLDRRRMSGELPERFSTGHVPQAHSSIRAAGDQRSTVRAERDLPGSVLMAFEGVQKFPFGRVPDAKVAIM